MRQLGAEGIVSKRAGSPYRGGPGRDWLKAKVSETGAFVITGFVEHEAVAVAELRDGKLSPVGLVKFGLAGKDLRQRLDPLRDGPATRAGVVPVRPELVAAIKFFGLATQRPRPLPRRSSLGANTVSSWCRSGSTIRSGSAVVSQGRRPRQCPRPKLARLTGAGPRR